MATTALAPPVILVSAGGFSVTQTPNCVPFVVYAGGAPNIGWPVTVIDAGGFPITLLNEDGSMWAAGPPAAPVNTVAPTIVGTTAVGQTLLAIRGTWTGQPVPTYTYVWKRGGVAIGGATGLTYVLQAADLGTMITVTVTATNTQGNASATSAGVGPVTAALTAPVNSVLPAITGTAAVGQTLTSSTGTWSGNPTPTYAYQWLNAGVAIGSATASTYALQASDEGDLITVTVTATNSQGSAAATSASVGPIAPLVTDVGGAALLTGETAGFATDFTYATDANRVAVKVASVNTEYAVDSFYSQAGTSAKMVYDVAGVLGWSPHNLMVQSQTFNVTWTLLGSTLSSDAIIAPDGTLTADRMVETSAASEHKVYMSCDTPASPAYAFSVYAKASGRDWFYVMTYDGGVLNTYFDITNGVVGNVAAGCTAAITAAGGGWYRCVVSRSMAGPGYFQIGTASANGVDSFTGDISKGIYLWGAQINKGTTATSYVSTTTAARIGCALDYDPVTHAAKGLLVEPQATNAMGRSNDLSVGWTTSGFTVAQNATGPLGANTAWTVTCTAGSATKWTYIDQFVGGAVVTRYSIYAKAGTLNWIALGDGTGGIAHAAFFNLAAGTVGTVVGRFSAATIQSVGNGWYRCSATNSGASYIDFSPHSADNQAFTWTAAGGETLFVSAAQAEAGSVATSYIPTTSATATRAADSVTCLTSTFPWSAAGSNSIISNAAGNEVSTTTTVYWALHDGTDAERYLLDTSSGTKKARLFTADASVTQTDLFGAVGAPVAGTFYKVGVALATNDFAGSIDGGTVATDTAATLPTVTTLQLGGSRTSTGRNVYLKTIKIVPRRMANATLQTETAP